MMVYQNSHSIKEILSRVVILDYNQVCCQNFPLYIYIYIERENKWVKPYLWALSTQPIANFDFERWIIWDQCEEED